MNPISPIPLQSPLVWIALLAALLWLANERQVQPFRAAGKPAQKGDHCQVNLKWKVFMLRKPEWVYFFAVGSIIVVNIYTQRKREVLTTIIDQRQEIRSFPHSRRLREGEPVDKLWITFGGAGDQGIRDRGKGGFIAARGSRVRSSWDRTREGLGRGSPSWKGQNQARDKSIQPAPSGKILGLPDPHQAETSRKGVPGDGGILALNPLPGCTSRQDPEEQKPGFERTSSPNPERFQSHRTKNTENSQTVPIDLEAKQKPGFRRLRKTGCLF